MSSNLLLKRRILTRTIGYASLAENMARSGEISRIWGPSIIAHNTTRRSHGQDLLRVWLQPSFRRGEMFVFPLPYPCYTTWALGKTVQVKFLMIDTINLDMNDPGKRKTRPDSTEFSLFFVTWASAPHSSSNRQLARPWSTETKWSSRFVDELPTDWVNWTERLTPEVTCRSPKVAHFRRDLHTLLVHYFGCLLHPPLSYFFYSKMYCWLEE